MDKEIEVVTLEDNLDYVILTEVNIDSNKYMVLSREEDPNVVVVRKVIIEDGNEYLTKVNTEIENEVKENKKVKFSKSKKAKKSK